MDDPRPTVGAAPSLRYRNQGNAQLLDLILLSPGRALDIGCGAGDNAALLSERGWNVEGITIDSDEADVAQRFCTRVHLGDLEDGLPGSISGLFDVAILSHVLEHVRNPEAVLRQVAAVLTPDGVVAVSLPNVLHYRQRLAFLAGYFDYTDTGTLDRTHLRFFTHASAPRMIESAGYEILHAVPDGPLPAGRLTTRLPDRLQSRLGARAVARMPGLLAYQFLFVARPRRRTQPVGS